ncbi:cytochrome C oxidase subunit IV family protein [Aquirufa sp. HETE-83D]|uniref:Cytochrome C oxidase subunit IV family protein n=1 Tax=Aquirufa esocilacus TaxID=3096513 RepID=A0ABW6DP46_9BACT
MASHAAHGTSEKEIAPPNTGAIWKTFWILLILTAIEFVIAFTMPANTLRVAIFCGMTIVKAFYIVGEFMHLKHEVKSLIWMVLIPTIFVVWLLVALIYEGGHLY